MVKTGKKEIGIQNVDENHSTTGFVELTITKSQLSFSYITHTVWPGFFKTPQLFCGHPVYNKNLNSNVGIKILI